MRYSVALALLAFCLAFVKADPETCLQRPAVIPPGGVCGSTISCQYGSYCSLSKICTTAVTVASGADCSNGASCELGATCKGIENFQKFCVFDSYPGQDCSTSPTSFIPSCGSGLSCSGGNRCTGGVVGDSCLINSDCISPLLCDPSKLVCSPLSDGTSCFSSFQCSPASYCSTSTGVCTAKATSGACTVSSQCANGYDCTLSNPANLTIKTCVQQGSVAAGAFCGTSTSCQSNRCIGNYCAAKSVSYCVNSNMCAANEVCDCSGLVYQTGLMGTCQANPCYQGNQAFLSCYNTNCVRGNYFNGSCIANNCKQLFQTYMVCNSASGLVISLLSATLLALFVSYISPKI